MTNMSYYFYMAEAEGLLPTRAGKINAVINAVKEYPRYDDLSDREIRYINASIG